MKKTYDWEAIKRDYRTGKFKSDRALCRKWEVPEATLRHRKKGNPKTGELPWERDLVDTFKHELKNKSIKNLAQTITQNEELRINDEQTVENAASAALIIISEHRGRIKDLNTISDRFKGVLLEALLADDPDILKKWKGRNESPTDVLAKLTKVTSELIKLERQAVGLEGIESSSEDEPIVRRRISNEDAKVIKDIFDDITDE